MKFKHIVLAVAAAAVAVPASAQSLQGKKIYINPGHGGYEATTGTRIEGQFANGYRSDGSNSTDRWNSTVPFPSVCEEGCWESKHNLWRGLELKRLLEQAGATVKISRTENRPEDDRILTEIGTEATQWGADMFVSIHTNGNGANHVMTMFRGADPRPGQTDFNINNPDIPASKDMAVTAWRHLHDNNLTCWQALKDESSVRAVSDSAFYGTWTEPYHLGVFRKLWVPGFLAECSFHDYKPEAHRLLNPDYSRLIAYQLYTAICEYFSAPQPTTGIVSGAVKDSKRIFRDPLFLGATYGDHDQYLPLNGAKVTLVGQGVTKEYVTDNFYNGIFFFPDLQPGTYQLHIEAEGYEPQDAQVVCEAAKSRGPIVMLNDPNYDPMQTAMPNVFASALEAVGANAVRFTLNGDAKNVAINLISNGTVVSTIDLGPKSKGVNSVEFSSDLPAGDYDWSITASNDAVGDEPGQITTNGDPLLDIANARGVAVDANPASPFFGRVYVTSIEANGKKGQRMGTGLYILDAALSDVTGQGGTPYQGGETWKGNSSPYRPAVAPNGDVYVCDWSDGHSGIWVMNPAAPAEAWRPVFGGTRNGDGLASEGGVKIHGSVCDVFVTGTGADTKIFSDDEDYDADGKQHVLRYDIGTSTSPWAVAPSHEYGIMDDKVTNGNQSIAPDGLGGVWICQYRYSADAYPVVAHINGKTGEFDYSSQGTTVFGGSGPVGAMAVSPDGSMIAVPNTSDIAIAAITYNADGVPTLEHKWTIGSTYGKRPFGAAFDAAGNLYVAYNDNGGGIGAWALPKADNTFTTPAASKLSVSAGVDDIIAGADNEATTYFDLMGRPVDSPVRGNIYIARTGSKVQKVIFND